ncbi:hypothetical protein M1O55_03590 [Dehalococcoidia bacterium]|nr:hypothetical protein [Dehalococcoidia bacterium]
MPQPQRFHIPTKFDLSTTWSYGPRTLEWERLWQRIFSNTITKEHRPEKEEPNPESVSDDV